MTNTINESYKKLIFCYQNFLIWLLEYCKENDIPIWKEMGFVGHLERTIAALGEIIDPLESQKIWNKHKNLGADDDLGAKPLPDAHHSHLIQLKG